MRELIIDSFAGGGGASFGIEMALGRSPDIAINHDAEAIALHAANHPTSKHYREDIWKVDPLEATGGRPVGLMWLSPDCKHFSKAKGGKPVSKRVRGLAWVAIRWASAVRPRVIVLENVEEFKDWGPVLATGRPCPVRKGQTFRSFKRKLEHLGYEVDHGEMRACDYGAPTIRRRLFLIARCDGQPIVWPTPTHGKGRPFPWRTAAECIDWSIPCPSIFSRPRPLADNTLKRIAAGLRRYVIESPRPYFVSYYGSKRPGDDRTADLLHPLPTQTTENRFGLVTPVLSPVLVNTANGKTTGRGPNVWPMEEPLRTITASPGFALAVPTLIQTGYGEREGQAPRVPGLDKPLGTAVAGGVKHALVTAFLAKHYTERAGQVQAASLFAPLPTVTAIDHNALVSAYVTKLRGDNIGHPADEPLHTLSAGGTHFAAVRAFLVKYYGTDQDPSLFEPLHTATTKDRFALVAVEGQDYAIVDIGMRMLWARELYRAQGFPDSYVIAVPFLKLYNKRGKKIKNPRMKLLSKTAQVRMVGNSVSPPVAAAIVQANVPEMQRAERAA